ncbi:hypothetical protein JQ615_15845 [Bradyrhizobium jicamae]|uniref:PIN domain-containing protein n=1 Tax=Bradyrhizobium jicamae TaxID=280332 RepID=A0ABS5FJK2_9BRAD|nr:hypothetical protein [Bradyrhizobium jicamae]MBR0796869.1 hypothetical protein [Bradyrhizobium jicamae]
MTLNSAQSAKLHVSDGPTFRMVGADRADGRPNDVITFSGENIRPLGYSELIAAKLHEKLAIPVEVHNSNLLDTNISGLGDDRTYTFSFILESRFTSRAIGLVKGGWLPSAFAASCRDAVVLVDRNIVTEMVGRFDGGKAVGTEPDFIDLFANRPVRINPVLYAMEGNGRSIPAPQLVHSLLEEAVTKMEAALPSAKLVVSPDSLQGALGLIEESRAGIARKQQFLMRVAPSITAPVSARKMRRRWDEVLAAADDCTVPRRSLVVLAALSSIVVPNGKSPAKRLLKIKPDYRVEDAYNALVDLRSLEFLIYMFALFPSQSILLCTADKDLALFWTGIRAFNFGRTDAGISVEFSPVDELLGGSTAPEWRETLRETLC